MAVAEEAGQKAFQAGLWNERRGPSAPPPVRIFRIEHFLLELLNGQVAVKGLESDEAVNGVNENGADGTESEGLSGGGEGTNTGS